MFGLSLLLALPAALLPSLTTALALQYDKLERDVSSSNRISNIRHFARTLQTRNESSTCLSYGIDFQDEQSYFINSGLNVPFTAVSQFQNCNSDIAYVVLVNDATGEQYQCSAVPTVPDNVSQTSICPINKDEMSSGDWTLIVIGDNGDGHPFAYQRDFYFTVGIPTSVTTTPTVTYTYTAYPNTTVTDTTLVYRITTVDNNQTITIPGQTLYDTITPAPTSTTSTVIKTRTVTRWTKSLVTITSTYVPSCTVPSRPGDNDPSCRIIPTVVPIPSGLSIAPNYRREKHLAERAPDAPTITLTASIPINSTTTSYAPTTTFTNTALVTTNVWTTLPPATDVEGTVYVHTTLPQSTSTITDYAYTRSTSWTTAVMTWTYMTRQTPSPEQSQECREQGGHFGKVYGY